MSQARFPPLFVLFKVIGMVELGLLDLKERAYQVSSSFHMSFDSFTRVVDIAHSEVAHRREYSIRGVLSILCDLLGGPQGPS